MESQDPPLHAFPILDLIYTAHMMRRYSIPIYLFFLINVCFAGAAYSCDKPLNGLYGPFLSPSFYKKHAYAFMEGNKEKTGCEIGERYIEDQTRFLIELTKKDVHFSFVPELLCCRPDVNPTKSTKEVAYPARLKHLRCGGSQTR